MFICLIPKAFQCWLHNLPFYSTSEMFKFLFVESFCIVCDANDAVFSAFHLI